MSEKVETLFEINAVDKIVKALDIPLDAELEQLKIIVNDVDINRNMKIASLKIVKVLK